MSQVLPPRRWRLAIQLGVGGNHASLGLLPLLVAATPLEKDWNKTKKYTKKLNRLYTLSKNTYSFVELFRKECFCALVKSFT